MSATEPLGGAATKSRWRPSPRLAQFKRTWYFFRRNSLAMVGLGIILVIVAGAAYAAAQPYNWTAMTPYCATNFGPKSTMTSSGGYNVSTVSCSPYVCNYQTTLPTNYADFCGGHWYKEPYSGSLSKTYYSGAVPPTISFSTFQSGTMPFGSISASDTSLNDIYNLYTELLRGSDWSLIFSVSIVGSGALIGLLLGAVAGFWGGAIDEALMRIVDVFLSIPQILFIIVMVSVLLALAKTSQALEGPTTELSFLVLGFVLIWWPFYARLVRGQVLVVREQKYVEAARASGAGKGRILLKHIIPNSLYPVFIQFSLDVGTIPIIIGGLVYLHFPIFPNESPYFPEWGALSSLGVTGVGDYLRGCQLGSGCFIPWWQIIIPGVALFLYAISVNLLADGLRDALDPRLRR